MKEENMVYSNMELFLDKMARKSLKVVKAKKKDVFDLWLNILGYIAIVACFFYVDNVVLKIVLGILSFLLSCFAGFLSYSMIKLYFELKEDGKVFLLRSSILSDDKAAHIINVTFLDHGLKLGNFVFDKDELLEFTQLVIAVFGEDKAKELIAETITYNEYSFYNAVRLHSKYSHEFNEYNIKNQNEKTLKLAESIVNKAGKEG